MAFEINDLVTLRSMGPNILYRVRDHRGAHGGGYRLIRQTAPLMGNEVSAQETDMVAVGLEAPPLEGSPGIEFEEGIMMGMDTNGQQPQSDLAVVGALMEAGVDLRDLGIPVALEAGPDPGQTQIPIEPFSPLVPGIVAASALVARFGATRIGAILGGLARGTRHRWNSLPGGVRAALIAIGVIAGSEIDIDWPFVGDEFGPGDHISPHMVDGHLGAHIVGGWTANGVKFYRLSDGKLAVQNKRGRWKVWRPKKPIVLMPSGAVNLRTMLRADRVLNKQAKQIASMLNRRTGGKRAAKPAKQTVVLPHGTGQVVEI